MIAKLSSRLGIEIWKDIPGYKGLYKISNLGKVKSLNYRGTNKIYYLKCNTKRCHAHLFKNSIPEMRSRAVWMAITFLNFKPSGSVMVVDHIDNDKTNDSLYNLQIITNRKNITKDSTNQNGYTGVAINGKKWSAKININYKRIHLGTFNTPKEASEAYQNALKKI